MSLAAAAVIAATAAEPTTAPSIAEAAAAEPTEPAMVPCAASSPTAIATAAAAAAAASVAVATDAPHAPFGSSFSLVWLHRGPWLRVQVSTGADAMAQCSEVHLSQVLAGSNSWHHTLGHAPDPIRTYTQPTKFVVPGECYDLTDSNGAAASERYDLAGFSMTTSGSLAYGDDSSSSSSSSSYHGYDDGGEFWKYGWHASHENSYSAYSYGGYYGGSYGGGGTPPPPAGTPPPPAPPVAPNAPIWTVLSGGQYCEIDGACVSTGHGSYTSNEHCVVAAGRPLRVYATSFYTESYYDKLSFSSRPGHPYSGSVGPSGVYMGANDTMTWSSDSSVNRAATVCAYVPSMAGTLDLDPGHANTDSSHRVVHKRFSGTGCGGSPTVNADAVLDECTTTASGDVWRVTAEVVCAPHAYNSYDGGEGHVACDGAKNSVRKHYAEITDANT